MKDNQLSYKFKNLKSKEEKRIFYSTIARAVLMGFALVATVWMISLLNTRSLFSGNDSTGAFLGITAGRGQ